MRILKYFPLALLAISLVFSGGCRKDQFTTSTSAKLRFSVDTLTFDTVFTTIGSVTLSMKVFNDNASKVKISSVTLGGGANSVFKINVDGAKGPALQNVEIDGKDSIYIFVQVTDSPNYLNKPVVIFDSIQFVTNGNHQQVILAAAGQDVHLYNSQAINTLTWNNDKPYVILNSLLVNTGATLTINSGVTIYMGNNSGLIVGGTLTVNGNSSGQCKDSVVFRGLRTESYYTDVPGQWSGIYILRNANCTIDHAIIKNSYYGLNIGAATTSDLTQVFAPPAGDTVRISNTIIKNSESTAIFCFAWNATFKKCLVYNAGSYMVTFALGGTYEMDQCTMANYGSAALSPSQPILQLSNLATTTSTFLNGLNATFNNCIMDGSSQEQLSLSNGSTDSNKVAFHFVFDHSLVKTAQDTGLYQPNFVSVLLNTSPIFNNQSTNDYSLASGSPCIGAGKTVPGIFTDIICKSYNPTPSIGCYEKQ